MKKQTKIAGLFISFCLLAVMLAGCGSSSKSASYENSSVAEAPAAYDSGGVYSNYTYDGEAAAPEEAPAEKAVRLRLIIRPHMAESSSKM